MPPKTAEILRQTVWRTEHCQYHFHLSFLPTSIFPFKSKAKVRHTFGGKLSKFILWKCTTHEDPLISSSIFWNWNWIDYMVICLFSPLSSAGNKLEMHVKNKNSFSVWAFLILVLPLLWARDVESYWQVWLLEFSTESWACLAVKKSYSQIVHLECVIKLKTWGFREMWIPGLTHVELLKRYKVPFGFGKSTSSSEPFWGFQNINWTRFKN